MKPVDMKVSRKALEASEGLVAAPGVAKGKVYPWGLEIRLSAAVLDKLGWTELPDVGAECVINAVAEVTEVRQSANNGEKTRTVVLQIAKMAATCEEDADESMKRGYARGPKRRGY